MSKAADWCLDLLYPTFCILCRRKLPPGIPSICPDCRRTMPSARDFHKKGKYFSDCICAVYYERDVREAIHRFKFGNTPVYHIAFGELVAERIDAEFDGRYDVLSWVPLAPDRRKDRGYDQVELIARDVSRRLCVPLTPLLRKRRGVGAQSLTTGVEARRANIAGAFRMKRHAPAAGRRVLLMDDVVTTGSTLSECAKTLLLAGAEDVVCATLAAAPLH